MRNIAEIIEDDRNGKQLSQTERQIAVAYIQGKYDAVRELKIGNNSTTNEVLDKIRTEVKEKIVKRPWLDFEDRERDRNDAFLEVLDIIDKHSKAESEDK